MLTTRQVPRRDRRGAGPERATTPKPKRKAGVDPAAAQGRRGAEQAEHLQWCRLQRAKAGRRSCARRVHGQADRHASSTGSVLHSEREGPALPKSGTARSTHRHMAPTYHGSYMRGTGSVMKASHIPRPSAVSPQQQQQLLSELPTLLTDCPQFRVSCPHF